MMNKTNIISLIFVAALLVYVFYSNYDKSPSEATLTVVVNEEGFLPSKIAIPVGATVTWVNEGERPHWPASNFHPNHTLYPAPGGCLGSLLDSCRGLSKSESFS